MIVDPDEIDALIEEVRKPGCDISDAAIRQLRPLLEELVARRMVQKITEALLGIQP